MAPNAVAAHGLLSPAPSLPRQGRPSKNSQRIRVENESFNRGSDQQLPSWRESLDTMVNDGSSRDATLPTPVFAPRPRRRIPLSNYFDPRHDITFMPQRSSSSPATLPNPPVVMSSSSRPSSQVTNQSPQLDMRDIARIAIIEMKRVRSVNLLARRLLHTNALLEARLRHWKTKYRSAVEESAFLEVMHDVRRDFETDSAIADSAIREYYYNCQEEWVPNVSTLATSFIHTEWPWGRSPVSVTQANSETIETSRTSELSAILEAIEESFKPRPRAELDPTTRARQVVCNLAGECSPYEKFRGKEIEERIRHWNTMMDMALFEIVAKTPLH